MLKMWFQYIIFRIVRQFIPRYFLQKRPLFLRSAAGAPAIRRKKAGRTRQGPAFVRRYACFFSFYFAERLAFSTDSGVSGSFRRRVPIAFATALPIAAGVGEGQPSLRPLAPYGPLSTSHSTIPVII